MFSIIEYEINDGQILGRRVLPMYAASRAQAQIELRRYLNLFRQSGKLDATTWWAETGSKRMYFFLKAPAVAPVMSLAA